MIDVNAERIKAWQCIGCGRIEGAQPCIGICQDRKAEFVYAAAYDQIVAELAVARDRVDVLAAVLRQVAGVRPRHGAWESSYRALQDRARAALAVLSVADRPPAPARLCNE